MNYLNLLFFGALFLLVSCEVKKQSTTLDKENVEKFHEIKSFLGLKKGMTSQNVIDLLNSKSINHSGLISSFKLQSGEDFNPEQYRKKQIQFINVFDHPIGTHKIDKFHLFFKNDILYHFSFFKVFSSKKTKNDGILDQGWLFRPKYGSIVGFISETLMEKYGQPYVSSNLEGIAIDSPDLNLDLNLTDKLNAGSSYSVIWRPTNENDLRIYIDNHQELYSNSDKMTFYDCSFHILVDFSNENIEKMLKQ